MVLYESREECTQGRKAASDLRLDVEHTPVVDRFCSYFSFHRDFEETLTPVALNTMNKICLNIYMYISSKRLELLPARLAVS